MKIIKGNIFEHIPKKNDKRIVIPHCVNDIGGWGSGFVLAINKFSPLPKEEYLKWFNKQITKFNKHTSFSSLDYDFSLGECQNVYCGNNVCISNMVGQHKTIKTVNKPVKYWALAHAMRNIAYNKDCFDEIWTIRFGSGLAGGRQDFIEELINEIWVEQNIPVTMFEL